MYFSDFPIALANFCHLLKLSNGSRLIFAIRSFQSLPDCGTIRLIFLKLAIDPNSLILRQLPSSPARSLSNAKLISTPFLLCSTNQSIGMGDNAPPLEINIVRLRSERTVAALIASIAASVITIFESSPLPVVKANQPRSVFVPFAIIANGSIKFVLFLSPPVISPEKSFSLSSRRTKTTFLRSSA